MLTWFMRTSMPAFNPFATESSSKFSKRFFSLTTGFRKSVPSTCMAYHRGIERDLMLMWGRKGRGTYQFFIKVDLHNALDHISDMNKLEKLDQWRDRCRCQI